MNRDSHNISQAYLKSRLLKEQTNEADNNEEIDDVPGEWNNGVFTKYTPQRIEYEKWEKKYPTPNFGERMDESYYLEFYFRKRVEELEKDFPRRYEKISPDDPIIYELIEKYASKGKDGYPRILDRNGKWIDEPYDIVDTLYYELNDKRNPSSNYSDDEDADSGSHDNEGFDDTAHDDDPTGQDEPVDTRSYSDVRTSDRLDYANRMVRSGKWDRERAEEYKRGA